MKKIIKYILLILLFQLLSIQIFAQLDRPKIISAYIYNFAKNVQWQNEESIKEFKFLVISDEPKINSELINLSKKTLRNKPINVSVSTNLNNIDKVQLIFVAKEQSNSIVDIYDRIEGKNILLITDGYTDKRLIMINFYETNQSTLKFEINKANIVNQHIRVLQDMILLGGTEIDVANLYKEGQNSLRSIQKHSENLEKNLRSLEKTIESKSNEVQIIRDSLLKQTQKIKEQQAILDNQLLLLQKRDAELQKNQSSIEEQKEIFKKQSEELLNQKENLKKGNDYLNILNKNIAEQKNELLNKSNILKEKGVTINRQQNILYLLIIIIALVIILGFSVFIGYKNKKKLNIELEKRVSERTLELNNANEILIVELNERKKVEEELNNYRKHLEEMVNIRTLELKNANERLSAIFQATNVGIVVLKDRIIQQCNARMEEIFRYEPDEFIGLPSRVWYIDDDNYSLGGQPVVEQINQGLTHHREQQLIRKDGSTFWARLVGRVLDPKDPSKGMVGVIEDITIEKENIESLKIAMESAKSADRLKSAFLATMSHELRTPLNSIIGFTGILLQELPGKLNPEQKKQLGMIQKSGRHLLSLINDILDLSKIESGQLKLSKDTFLISEIIHNVIDLSVPFADSKNLVIDYQIDKKMVEMIGDKFRTQQIVLNLVNNALKFTERGSVTIIANQKDKNTIVSVIDTGIGIESSQMDALFKPFIQIDSNITRLHEGTGLGLSICKRLIDLSGGTIEVESEYGKGSIFTIYLPIKETTIKG